MTETKRESPETGPRCPGCKKRRPASHFRIGMQKAKSRHCITCLRQWRLERKKEEAA